jgi:cell shape-determining protein MreD
MDERHENIPVMRKTFAQDRPGISSMHCCVVLALWAGAAVFGMWFVGPPHDSSPPMTQDVLQRVAFSVFLPAIFFLMMFIGRKALTKLKALSNSD